MKRCHSSLPIFVRGWLPIVLALLLSLSACAGITTSRIDERGIIHLTREHTSAENAEASTQLPALAASRPKGVYVPGAGY